jgi:hypothetical protein
MSFSMSFITALAMLLSLTTPTQAYSVLTHEAIIDATWETGIKPLLTKRFGSATPDELRKAHAYAYGGGIIQDMGYYPFGSKLFSDLTHYVRGGAFVEEMIRESQDINEYAFALGSLCHYAADSTGHPVAVNPSVPILYPRDRRYGATATYEDDPVAHIRTEFGFDVVQVARGKFVSEDYHDFIGFEVSKPLLERAFKATYGIELKSLFKSLDLALGSYRRSVSTIIPEMTKVAWLNKQDDIQKLSPGITAQKYRYTISRSAYEKEWGTQYEKPGLGPRVLSIVLRIMPPVGPFKALSYKVPTPEAEKLFNKSVDSTTVRYRQLLAEVAGGRLKLEEVNFDTGRPSRIGEYGMADGAYAKLLDMLASNKFESVSPELRENILAFFAGGTGSAARTAKNHDYDSNKAARELDQLKAVNAQRVQTGRQ